MDTCRLFISVYVTRLFFVTLTLFEYLGFNKVSCTVPTEPGTAADPVNGHAPSQSSSSSDPLYGNRNIPGEQASGSPSTSTASQHSGDRKIEPVKDKNKPGRLTKNNLMYLVTTECGINKHICRYVCNPDVELCEDDEEPSDHDPSEHSDAEGSGSQSTGMVLKTKTKSQVQIPPETVTLPSNSPASDENQVISSSWWDKMTNGFQRLKNWVIGDPEPKKEEENNKEPPKPSIWKKGTDFIKEKSMKLLGSISGKIIQAANKMGITPILAKPLKKFALKLFGMDEDGQPKQRQLPEVVTDEACFRQKLEQLNSFYLTGKQFNLSNPDQQRFYTGLPDSVDVNKASSPFETVDCSGTTKYVMVSNAASRLKNLGAILATLITP